MYTPKFSIGDELIYINNKNNSFWNCTVMAIIQNVNTPDEYLYELQFKTHILAFGCKFIDADLVLDPKYVLRKEFDKQLKDIIDG